MQSKEFNLFSRFQLRGAWWFPNEPERKVTGTVVWDGHCVTLDVIDVNGRISSFWDYAPHGIPDKAMNMLGELENGRPCTLIEVYGTSRRNADGFPELTIEAHSAFFGVHLPSPESVLLKSVTVEFTDLEKWMFEDSVFHEEDIREDGGSFGWRVDLKMPTGIHAYIPAIDADVNFGYSATKRGGFTSLELKVTPTVSISPGKPQHFDWYLNTIRDLQNWLSLLIGKLVQPSRLQASTEQEPYENIQVIQSWMGKRREESLYPTQPRVGLHSIRDEIELLLQKWFDHSERLRDVFNLFFGTIHAENMYVEFHYLSLIQAVEAYSRAATNSTYLSPDDYDKIRDELVRAIPQSTPEGLKSSLKNRIKYGNEFSLRKRLDRLLRSLEVPTLDMICQNREQYVERVVATRNYLTHYTSELKAQAWHQNKIFNACQSLTVLLTVLLFKEVGLNEERIREALNGHFATSQAIALYRQKL